MNEEIKNITVQLKEILNKYPNRQLEILLYVFGRDNLMNMINEPTYEELQQENQQLKERHYLIQGGRGNCKTLVLMLQKENEQYKSVLDEIREYIKPLKTCEYNFIVEEPNIINPHYEICDEVKEHLLQISDKVKE